MDSAYVKQLEESNHRLQEKLDASEKILAEKNDDVCRRLPRWFKTSETSWFYGWECRNIADVRLIFDADKPWRIWIIGDIGDDDNKSSILRKFNSLEEAKDMVEITFSNSIS